MLTLSFVDHDPLQASKHGNGGARRRRAGEYGRHQRMASLGMQFGANVLHRQRRQNGNLARTLDRIKAR
jgi:hypothetical protein